MKYLQKIDLLGFEKETAAFEYITDDNLNYFIENKPVQAGTSSKEGCGDYIEQLEKCCCL